MAVSPSYPTTFLLIATDTTHSKAKLPSPYQVLSSSDLDDGPSWKGRMTIGLKVCCSGGVYDVTEGAGDQLGGTYGLGVDSIYLLCFTIGIRDRAFKTMTVRVWALVLRIGGGKGVPLIG